MSTVTVINTGGGNGGVYPGNDSASTRAAHALAGVAATGAGAAAFFTACRLDDRFFSEGKNGEYLKKQPLLQKFKSWREFVMKHPKGGSRAIWGIGIASALTVCMGLNWLKKSLTGS